MFATKSFNPPASNTYIFQQARMRGRLGRCWAALTGRSHSLYPLPAATLAVTVGGHFAGLQIVPIQQIRGSEGRIHDFDSDFNPLKDHLEERWLRVFTAWRRGAALPAVELIRVSETYYVRDGHNRVSVARLMGQEYIDAVVTVWE